MRKLVLLRHGESTWNLENRFTGWTDVGLSEKGIAESHTAAKLLMESGYNLRSVLYFRSEAGDQDALDRA